MNEAWLKLLNHALGVSPAVAKSLHGYRNRYCATIGGPEHAAMMEMEAAGLVQQGRVINNGTMQFFYATRAGCEAIGLSPKAIERALED